MAMACSSAESDAPRTESPQSSLVDTAIHRLNIAIEVIPRSLTIKVEGTAPKSYDVLCGKEAFSEKRWQYEFGHFVKALVQPDGEKLPNCLVQTKKLQAIARTFLDRVAVSSKEVIYDSVLGLCLLSLKNLREVGSAISSFDEDLTKRLLDKYSMDNFIQAAVNHLLNQYEKLVSLEVEGKPFAYPPFQKALPYFPNYGYQVTMVFKDGDINGGIMKVIVNIMEKLKAKCEKIDGNHPEQHHLKVAHSGFNVGFELNFWIKWCKLLHRRPSSLIQDAARILNSEQENFIRNHPKLKYTAGHIWFYLKADTDKDCQDLLQLLISEVEAYHLPVELLITTAFKKNGGRLFDGQFLDGISSAVDAISMIREVLIPPLPVAKGQISPEGGTFAFVQFFQFDNPLVRGSSQPAFENMIGRASSNSETLAHLDQMCHIKRARIIRRRDGTNTELIRQPLPYVPEKNSGSRGPSTKGLFFVAFGKSIERFFEILKNMLGPTETYFSHDLLLSHVQGRFGKLFYCPNTNELEALPEFTSNDLYPPISFWNKYVSKNPSYFYNHIHYLYTMSTGYVHGDPPSKRVLYLMSNVFARWHSTWMHKFDVPRLPHLKKFLKATEKSILEESVQVRKGFSYKKMLGEVFTSNIPLPDEAGKIYGYSEYFDTYRIDPKELVVGVTDRLSFGSGKEVMPYLMEGSETTLSWDLALTEAGNMGHIVPGHKYLLDLGVAGMLKKLRSKLQQRDDKSPDQIKFYQSAVYAFEGVQLYLLKYACLARKTAKKMHNRTTEASDRKNLREIAERMVRLAVGDSSTFSFHDAVQLVFSMHCCLHLVGQPVSVGRLDQLLISYYERDIKNHSLSPEKAQEIIDTFFIKFDEHVVLNPYNIPYGHITYGSTCVTGRGGPFPTGDSMNQWIQQITVGGYGEDGVDACNEITLMCLKACRRLPLNAPCVSLRLTALTPVEVKKEAAKALLSGGAHPILFHDDKMVQGLYEVLRQSFIRSSIPEPEDLIQVARNYSCDGCYEPMFTGSSEFKFAYIFLLKAVIYTINSGADYQNAGPLHLAGDAVSYRTPLPEDIEDFEQFKVYFLKHLKLMVENLYNQILNSYGNPWLICPSPLLSCLLEGCLDSGMDMTNGGARFHIISPMYVGFANTVNSLYNVKKMVYDRNNTASLETLRMALFNNWGENMVVPFYDANMGGTIHTKMWAQRFCDLRDQALSLPKYGTDSADDEINELALWLVSEMDKMTYNCLYEEGPIFDKYEELRQKYSLPEKPFLFQIMTGSGTFENYVSVGAGCAATPDGRLNGQPIASDCSQQPFPQDRPVPQTEPLDIVTSLKPYTSICKHVPNGCEIDLTIPEDFPLKSLVEFIDMFIKGDTGSNLITITCVDKATQKRAQMEPQKFNLIRNRMGGWSNFFVSMFPEHQLQHARRPVFAPHKECSSEK